MSKAAEKASDSFGDVLTAGLATRGGGAHLPAQATAGAEVELTPQARLAELENLIETSLGNFQRSVRQLQVRHRQELGLLLEEIQRDELFLQAGHAKFGPYIKARWGWDRSYAYRLMDLALVRRALAPLGPAVADSVPESQARQLAPVVRYNGDEAAQGLLKRSRQDATEAGKKLTAAIIQGRREAEGLGAPPSKVSPIGDSDEDEVVDAELVDEDEVAELVSQRIRAAADLAERAVRLLDEALAPGVAPLYGQEAAVDESRLRSAMVRLGKRADRLPGLRGA